jgi:hypothetical protein
MSNHEWHDGYASGWFDSIENPGSSPAGSDDFVLGWFVAAYDVSFWKLGWDDFHAGQTMPRFDPEVPEAEDLWKEGYIAAFLDGAE